jgi:hypothetical protein
MTPLFWKALFGLLAFDCLGFGRGFARLHRFIRNFKGIEGTAGGMTVDRICEAVNYACVFYPKRVRCLQRSAVTIYLLRSHGVRAEMVMGARKAPFMAHAWVEVDGKPINERKDVRRIYGVWERC